MRKPVISRLKTSIMERGLNCPMPTSRRKAMLPIEGSKPPQGSGKQG